MAWHRYSAVHAMLGVALNRPATLDELVIGCGPGTKARKRFRIRLRAAIEEGLITESDGQYSTTEAGAVVLADLGGPMSTGAPTVRVFDYVARAA